MGKLFKYPVIIVSPHMDDSFLSMGGTIKNILKETDVTIVNVFSNTFFSINKTSQYNDVKRIRMCEEEKNRELIQKNSSNTLDIKYLNYDDALIRGEKIEKICDYPQGNVRNLTIPRGLKKELLKIFSSYNKFIIFGPSALGDHIDHLIVKTILDEICNKWIQYFEIPYAIFSKPTKKPNLFYEIDMDLKTNLTRTYKSQLFEMEDLMNDIKEYSLMDDKYYEFFYLSS